MTDEEFDRAALGTVDVRGIAGTSGHSPIWIMPSSRWFQVSKAIRS